MNKSPEMCERIHRILLAAAPGRDILPADKKYLASICTPGTYKRLLNFALCRPGNHRLTEAEYAEFLDKCPRDKANEYRRKIDIIIARQNEQYDFSFGD